MSIPQDPVEQFCSNVALQLQTRASMVGENAEIGPERLAAHLFPRVEGEPWMEASHLVYLSRLLVQLTDPSDDFRNLMVSMPPRHGKSELCSQYFPVWYLKKRKRKRIILTSYGADLARRFSRKSRDIIRENPSLGLRLASGQASKMDWSLSKGGGLISAGVGGPIGGIGGHLLILDDPYKNWEDARSAAYERNLREWWKSTFVPRSEPGASILLIATRWKPGDLCGWLLNRDPAKWTYIKFPAIAEEEDAIGRNPGDVLWPERFSREELLGLKNDVGQRHWQSEYQQHPTPPGGDIFKKKWFQHYRLQGGRCILDGGSRSCPLEDCSIFQVCDPAGTTSDYGDYFALTTWALCLEFEAPLLLLLDIFHERAETADHLGILQKAHEKWEPQGQFVEKEKYGLVMMQQAKRLGRPLQPLTPVKDKVARSWTAQSMYRQGQVYHRADLGNLSTLESELLDFPEGDYDDLVDTVSYAARVLDQWMGKGLKKKGRRLR